MDGCRCVRYNIAVMVNFDRINLTSIIRIFEVYRAGNRCLPQLLHPGEENKNETKIVNIQVNSLETIGGLTMVDRWVPEADTGSGLEQLCFQMPGSVSSNN